MRRTLGFSFGCCFTVCNFLRVNLTAPLLGIITRGCYQPAGRGHVIAVTDLLKLFCGRAALLTAGIAGDAAALL